MINPGDTSRCPAGAVCESCGAGDDLAVATASTEVGIVCVTICRRCDEELARLPGFAPVEAVRRCMAHAGHLGCTVDELADPGDGGAR